MAVIKKENVLDRIVQLCQSRGWKIMPSNNSWCVTFEVDGVLLLAYNDWSCVRVCPKWPRDVKNHMYSDTTAEAVVLPLNKSDDELVGKITRYVAQVKPKFKWALRECQKANEEYEIVEKIVETLIQRYGGEKKEVGLDVCPMLDIDSLYIQSIGTKYITFKVTTDLETALQVFDLLKQKQA